MIPQKFRKKPITIEAMRFDGYLPSAEVVIEWITSLGGVARPHDTYAMVEVADEARRFIVGGIHIDTLEGVMNASEGDWIIRGVQGEFYPCKPDIFAATYEPA